MNHKTINKLLQKVNKLKNKIRIQMRIKKNHLKLLKSKK